VRTSTLVQTVLFLVILAALVYVVVQVSSGWADWIVLGVIVAAVLGASLAAWNRRYPHATKKRRFTRDSSSKW
jgi:1,4-dihydroxy-2-naphthoate octaprenyltransferase